MKNKFSNFLEEKIKSEKEKRNLLFKNIKKEDLSYRNSEDYLLKKLYNSFIKYNPFPKDPYSKEKAVLLIEAVARKEFGDKFYDEQYAPVINKVNKKQVINIEQKQEETFIAEPEIIEHTTKQNKNCIPYNEGLTPEFIKKHWHLVRPCDPNEIIVKKEKKSNNFLNKKFKGYY